MYPFDLIKVMFQWFFGPHPAGSRPGWGLDLDLRASDQHVRHLGKPKFSYESHYFKVVEI